MKHFFFDLLLYKVIRIIFHIFAEISIFLYKLNRNNKKKNCIYSVPAVNTIGDA